MGGSRPLLRPGRCHSIRRCDAKTYPLPAKCRHPCSVASAPFLQSSRPSAAAEVKGDELKTCWSVKIASGLGVGAVLDGPAAEQ